MGCGCRKHLLTMFPYRARKVHAFVAVYQFSHNLDLVSILLVSFRSFDCVYDSVMLEENASFPVMQIYSDVWIKHN